MLQKPILKTGVHSSLRWMLTWVRKSDPIDLSMQWYNYDRPHMSLSRDERETPPKRLCARSAFAEEPRKHTN